MPRVPGAKDVILQPFWDSASITATTKQLTLFQTPKGQGSSVWSGVGGKALADTNMQLAGQLGSGWQFTCYTVQFSLAATAVLADAQKIVDQGTIEIIVGAKTYLELPLVFANAGGGLSGSLGTQTAASTNQFVTNGHPDSKAVFGFGELPITIMENENFSVRLTWQDLTGITTTSCRLLLNGQLSRGVQ